MPLLYPYADAFLRDRVTQAREDQAISYVATLGTLPAVWVPILITYKAYMIACVECMQAVDDTFATKLGAYRKDFDAALAQARAAQTLADAAAGTPSTGGGSFFTVDLSRG